MAAKAKERDAMRCGRKSAGTSALVIQLPYLIEETARCHNRPLCDPFRLAGWLFRLCNKDELPVCVVVVVLMLGRDTHLWLW